MNYPIPAILFAVITFAIAGPAITADVEPLTEEQKVFYFLGTVMGANLEQLSLTDDEVALVTRGMSESLAGTAIDLDAATYQERLNSMGQQRMAINLVREQAAAADYVANMAAEPGAITTDSGIVILELVAGSGDSPTAESTVKTHYHGTLRDGSVFDSSLERGEPLEFSLGKVIPCWREAIPTMKEGGKSKITCPSDLAYGERGSGAIPGGAALTFEVELLEIVAEAE